ncbi:MAG: glycosyltransferase family 4 protein [Candidatus Omnitrophica bacterium]|nr:glycosyltransferase family 4 protein [Candidatus Omnitrophota bacterium]
MKILMANKYFYLRGGSEYAYFDTMGLLRRHGHTTVPFSMKHARNYVSAYDTFFVSNVDYDHMGPAGKIAASLRVMYLFEARKKIMGLLASERFDVAHLHNIYHQISPSIIHSLKKRRVPVVMSLHDFKMVCPNYSLSMHNTLCSRCQKGRFYRCFLNRCVKGSRARSLVAMLEMYMHHRFMKIYDLVDVFIAPSEFLMNKLKEMGFNGKLVYLPNFINVNSFEPQYSGDPKTIVYFGRLVEGKGLDTLIDAMFMLPAIKLKIIGEGTEKDRLTKKAAAMRMKNVEFTGYQSGDTLWNSIKKAQCVVLPAENAENNPRSVLEAFALGKPVIATQAGGIGELVRDGRTGLVFSAGDCIDLSKKISLLIKDPELIQAMGLNARRFVEERYSSEAHYQRLIEIYRSVIKTNG